MLLIQFLHSQISGSVIFFKNVNSTIILLEERPWNYSRLCTWAPIKFRTEVLLGDQAYSHIGGNVLDDGLQIGLTNLDSENGKDLLKNATSVSLINVWVIWVDQFYILNNLARLYV